MRRGLALPAALAVVAGCVSLEPRPDPTRYYVLEPEASPPASTRPAVPVLGVGPVRLPAYLDRPELVTRAGPARLEIATVERWAAPLDVLFARALAENLRAAVPAGEVVGEPWPVGAAPEWTVSVDVLRFEGEPDGTAVLEARWLVRRGGALADQGSTIARERRASSDTAGTVVALSRTLGALARDVAAAVDARRGEARTTAP